MIYLKVTFCFFLLCVFSVRGYAEESPIVYKADAINPNPPTELLNHLIQNIETHCANPKAYRDYLKLLGARKGATLGYGYPLYESLTASDPLPNANWIFDWDPIEQQKARICKTALLENASQLGEFYVAHHAEVFSFGSLAQNLIQINYYNRQSIQPYVNTEINQLIQNQIKKSKHESFFETSKYYNEELVLGGMNLLADNDRFDLYGNETYIEYLSSLLEPYLKPVYDEIHKDNQEFDFKENYIIKLASFIFFERKTYTPSLLDLSSAISNHKPIDEIRNKMRPVISLYESREILKSQFYAKYPALEKDDAPKVDFFRDILQLPKIETLLALANAEEQDVKATRDWAEKAGILTLSTSGMTGVSVYNLQYSFHKISRFNSINQLLSQDKTWYELKFKKITESYVSELAQLKKLNSFHDRPILAQRLEKNCPELWQLLSYPETQKEHGPNAGDPFNFSTIIFYSISDIKEKEYIKQKNHACDIAIQQNLLDLMDFYMPIMSKDDLEYADFNERYKLLKNRAQPSKN